VAATTDVASHVELVDRAHLAAELVRPVGDEERVAENLLLDVEHDGPAAPRLAAQGCQRLARGPLVAGRRPGILPGEPEAHLHEDVVVAFVRQTPHACWVAAGRAQRP
jgi:hypothetical protein